MTIEPAQNDNAQPYTISILIAVIADDITGAAEVAGVGLRHGLRVALDTIVTAVPSDAQLWVVALDTRSMQRDGAVKEITKTVTQLSQLGVCQIFKKTDSVLRGHVVAELEAQAKIQGKSAVLLCPANPAGGRKIVDGTYYVNDIPLHETGFSKDPEFPATTSSVVELLKNISQIPVSIANASSVEDLQSLAERADDNIILAGSAAFFEAWLVHACHFERSEAKSKNLQSQVEMSRQVQHDAEKNNSARTLIVCGSAFHASHERVERARENGISVSYISPLWIGTPQLEQNLRACEVQAQQALQQNGRAVVAIDLPTLEGKAAAVALRTAVMKVTANVLQSVDIHEVIIEGGATAFAIAECMGYTRFLPVNELVPGVVRMKVLGHQSLYLTIKPGSYEFPRGILG